MGKETSSGRLEQLVVKRIKQLERAERKGHIQQCRAGMVDQHMLLKHKLQSNLTN